jgi:AraC-like DNA-binding protein
MNLSTILLLGSVQAGFLVVLILGKRRKTLSDWILAAWVALLGTHHLLPVLFDRGVEIPAAFVNLNAGVPLLQGPFLYLYVQTLTSGRSRLGLKDLPHLIPYGLFAIYVLWLLPHVGHTGASQVSVFRLSILLTTTILVSVPAYALTALLLLRRHRLRTLARHSETRGRDLSWLRWIVLALLAVWGVVIGAVAAELLAPGSAHIAPRHQMMSAVTLFIYVIGYFGFRQIAVGEPDRIAERTPESSPAPQNAKYQRSGLGSDETEALVVRLNRYLLEQKPYLKDGITLGQVAAGLDVSPNHLSQAINQGMNKNFYELINERRVEEFKRRVVEPKNRSYTLLAIALDSGFSSKSSFNRVFKQFTGISPRQYVERQASSDP